MLAGNGKIGGRCEGRELGEDTTGLLEGGMEGLEREREVDLVEGGRSVIVLHQEEE